MSLLSTLSYIANHPLNRKNKVQSFLRFIMWQIESRLISKPKLYNFGEKSKLLIKKGQTGATGNIYCGLHEFEDMSFVLHFLRDGDLFVDVGANIGSYTILASSEKGVKTIAIEPIPLTFKYLLKNIQTNNIENKVNALNIGIGSKNSQIKFTQSYDTKNRIAFDGEANTCSVTVKRLDDILNLKSPTLLKIDVEGAEPDVVMGMTTVLANEYLKGIIIELGGFDGRYGLSNEDAHKTLIDYGFLPFSYSPFSRKLALLESFKDCNTIYLRDLLLVENRIKHADKIKINNIKY